jgi:membrane-associated protease RseP (regulator of RpoE activity)
MNFLIYDLVLLGIFLIFIVQFLYRNRKNLKKDGLLFLYRTKWGMNLIDIIGKKYKKTLNFLSYVSITIGYLLMVGMLWLFGKIVYIYVFQPRIVQAIKIPPITPLVPYIDKFVPNLGLPSFYFIYWIIILAVIAIFHEFAHGVFMRRYDIKIKSTGFGFFPFFLPIFLAAFVEQDEKSMKGKNNFKQMAVLSAGTFANLLTGILFFGIMVLFFMFAFQPSGVVFDSYTYNAVGISTIISVGGIVLENTTYQNLVQIIEEGDLIDVKTTQGDYFITKEFLSKQSGIESYIFLYEDAPAIKNNLSGAITKINGEKISSIDELSFELYKYSPKEKITLTLFNGEDEHNQDLILGENPQNKSLPWLGIGFNDNQRKGLMGKIINKISFKDPHIYYISLFDVAKFIYDLLWWLVLICFSVALVNMLPMGIFDGGRFFYLTILSLTKSEKKAEKWFKGITKFLLSLVILIMVFWAISFF